MTRPIKATIDLSALRHNHGVARRHSRGARIWSVLKANAYGHGLLRSARALAELADGFALIELEGAIALREAGLRQPILLLEGFYSADELPLFEEYQLTPVVHSLGQVGMLAAASLALPIYLKQNSGMNRLGLNADEFHSALATFETRSRITDITLMTHFSDADTALGIDLQWARFVALRRELGEGRRLCHANSATLLRYPECEGGEGDWVRPGIMLYGSSPFPDLASASSLGLKPVMTLESELIAVRDLVAGDSVGYGGIFTAEAPLRIGVVACGYADGYPRAALTGTPVQVCGRRTRTLGRVSMDKICVDLTGIREADVGSPVLLWGGDPVTGLSADEVAGAAGTVSYELFCALASRVRVFERD